MGWSCSATSTGMRVCRARISGSMVSRFGARWVTTTNAIPGLGGIPLNRASSASTPPAEAPTPTMGKDSAMSGHNLERALRATLTLTYSRARPSTKKNCLKLDSGLSFWSWFRLRTCQQLARLVNGFACHFDLAPKSLDFIARVFDQYPGLYQYFTILSGHDARLAVRGGRQIRP